MYEYRDPYIIDFTNVKHYLQVHEIIKEALDFPDYYGNCQCLSVDRGTADLRHRKRQSNHDRLQLTQYNLRQTERIL